APARARLPARACRDGPRSSVRPGLRGRRRRSRAPRSSLRTLRLGLVRAPSRQSFRARRRRPYRPVSESRSTPPPRMRLASWGARRAGTRADPPVGRAGSGFPTPAWCYGLRGAAPTRSSFPERPRGGGLSARRGLGFGLLLLALTALLVGQEESQSAS